MSLPSRPGGGGGGGKNGRGIASVTKKDANTMRIAFDDSSTPVDLPLPAGADGKSIVNRGLWQANTLYNQGELVSNGAGLYRVLTTFTSPASFTTTNLEIAVASGALGKPGHYVSANPAATGPVLIVQGGAYVAANTNMLSKLTAQLYLKGSDGNLYVNGLVPLTWPSGASAGWRLALQAQSGGINIYWYAPGTALPVTLGTTSDAYVDLGTAGVAQDTVVFNPKPPYFDATAIKTVEAFTAASYANIAALEQVYTKFGTFGSYLYDDSNSLVSGRTLEFDPGQTNGLYRYFRSSYPSGSATFPRGSITGLARKAGGKGRTSVSLQAVISGSTYSAVEARLDTSDGSFRLYTVVGGVDTQLGAAIAKGASNDVEWWIRLYSEADTGVLRARAWAASGAEPSTWDFDTTQSAVTAAGMAGFGTNFDHCQFAFVGVSRGDVAAPTSLS